MGGGSVQSALAQPTCGQDLCVCLGAAKNYEIVATKSAKMISTKLKQSDGSGGTYITPYPASVDDSVCATIGNFTGRMATDPGDDDAQLGTDAVLLNPAPKVAASFMAYKVAKVLTPAVTISGDLVTGGGSVKNPGAVSVAGSTDFSGNHAKVQPCQQALIDFQSASTALQALAPTQTVPLNKIALKGTDMDINAGPGTNVLNLTSISLKPTVTKSYGYVYSTPSTLNINLVPTTDVMVINVAKTVSIGKECGIAVLGGNPSRVILNVTGKKSMASIGADATVDPIVLVANGGITAARGSEVGNLFGKNVTLRGATGTTDLFCP